MNTNKPCTCCKSEKETADCEKTALPEVMTTTMAYIPFQLDKSSYTAEMALREGTLFPVLIKPFCGRSVL